MPRCSLLKSVVIKRAVAMHCSKQTGSLLTYVYMLVRRLVALSPEEQGLRDFLSLLDEISGLFLPAVSIESDLDAVRLLLEEGAMPLLINEINEQKPQFAEIIQNFDWRAACGILIEAEVEIIVTPASVTYSGKSSPYQMAKELETSSSTDSSDVN